MSATVNLSPKKVRGSEIAKKTLRWVALFLGELRDGVTMINMQSAFLISSKYYTEKQAGILFFVFGMSQFIFQTPAGYAMDYSDKKVYILAFAAIATTCLTIFTAMFAKEYGQNLGLMIFIKFLQGSVTCLIPPGLNSISQGIVGACGMTQQVSRNEMMNHLGTAFIVLIGSLLAYALYPDNMAYLFVISPIACAGVVFFLLQIKPEHIDHDAARGLKTDASPDSDKSANSSYKSPSIEGAGDDQQKNLKTKPSFNFGWGQTDVDHNEIDAPVADTPLHMIRDPILVTFTLICFLFHMANGCVLPLVMQSLALEGGRSSMLLSGLCIIVAQISMVGCAKICGDYSGQMGRKPLFLIGLFSVGIRCLILVLLVNFRDTHGSSMFINICILSTQIFDGIGAGTFGTMYILVTSDISAGTGRFSFALGITTAAMNIGGTVSGYLGEALAQDLGYKEAFMILGTLSLVPAFIMLLVLPETLPKFSDKDIQMVSSMHSIAEGVNENADESANQGTGTLL